MYLIFWLSLLFSVYANYSLCADSNILQNVISNPVIFFDRKNYAYFVLSENSTEVIYKKLLDGFLKLEQQTQKSFSGDDYEISLYFGGNYNVNFTSADNFYETYGKIWCLEADNCFEGSRVKNKEIFVDQLIPINKPCPETQFKEFIVVISNTCLSSINKKLNDFEQCSLEYRNIILMLPTIDDVEKCAKLLNGQNVQLFSCDLSANEIEIYSDMKVKYQSTMEKSKMNILVMLTEFWDNEYHYLNPISVDIPLCKMGSISGYFQYILPNSTVQNVSKFTAPLNFNRVTYMSENYQILVKNTVKTEKFNCLFITEFLTIANTLPHNESQYNVLIIEDPYFPCLELDLLWDNPNRHLEIVVMHKEKIVSDYSKFISHSNTSLNHISFYNSAEGLNVFWKDTTVCRDNVPIRNITSKPTLIVKSTEPIITEEKSVPPIWWIIGGMTVIIVSIVIIFFILRYLYLRNKANERKSFIREKADSIISVTNIPKNAKYWSTLLNDKDLIIDYGKILGKGSKAMVHPALLMTDNSSGNVLSIKVAAKISTNFNTNSDSTNELSFLYALRHHRHIIELKGWTLCANIPVIITELAERNLLQYAKTITNYSKDIIKNNIQILFEISDALSYLAENKMIHRDIACRNVLLTETNIAKLADFGLCCKSNKNGIYKDLMHEKFPLKWLSIEVLKDGIFSEKSDVWSFGVLCWELFSFGAVPYSSMTHLEIIKILEDGKRLQKTADIPDDIYDLMLNCWNRKPNERPNFKEIHAKLEIILEYGYLQLQKK